MEPTIFENSILLCSGWIDRKLSLQDVYDLSIFAEASVIHDILIIPNPLIPRFRYETDHNTRDLVKKLIKESPYDQFVDFDHWLSGVAHTSWFSNNWQHIAKDKGINDSLASYLDKIAYLSEQYKATLVLPNEKESIVIKEYTQCIKAVTKEILSHYEKVKQQRFKKRIVEKYKKFCFNAPFFLDTAIRQAKTNSRKAVLNIIADMHNNVAPHFRELGGFLRSATDTKEIGFNKIIEDLLNGLINGKKIPKPYIKTIVNIISFIPALMGKYEVLAGKAKEIYDLVTSKNYSTIYSGLSIMNQIYDQPNGIGSFYEELKRVFGELNFDSNELKKFLAEHYFRQQSFK